MKKLLLLSLFILPLLLDAQECMPYLLASYDSGQSWDPISPSIPYNMRPTALASEDDGTLWAAVRTAGVMRLDAGASEWQLSGQGLPYSTYYTALAAYGDLLVTSTDKAELFYSLNGGKSWQKPIWGTPPHVVTDLLILNEWEILATTYAGMYYSADGGQSWSLRYEAIGLHDMALFDNVLYVAGRDGVHAFNGLDTTNPNCVFDGTMGYVRTNGDYLYLLSFRGEVMRQKFGSEGWEVPVSKEDSHLFCRPTVPDALFRGLLREDEAAGIFPSRFGRIIENEDRFVALAGEEGC